MRKTLEILRWCFLKIKSKNTVFFAALVGLFCGWILSCVFLQRQFSERQLRLKKQFSEDTFKYLNNVKLLRQNIYGNNKFHRKDAPSETKNILANFTTSTNDEYITLAYIGGSGDSAYQLTLYGDGSLYMEDAGKRQLISNVARGPCNSFFYRIITSGILNYSESVVSLKVALLSPPKSRGVTDRPTTEIRISIPKLKIDKVISVYAPDIELQNYPDIIEFQLLAQIEKEILDLRE